MPCTRIRPNSPLDHEGPAVHKVVSLKEWVPVAVVVVVVVVVV